MVMLAIVMHQSEFIFIMHDSKLTHEICVTNMRKGGKERTKNRKGKESLLLRKGKNN